MSKQLPYVIQNSGGRTSAWMTEELLKDQYIRDNSIVLFQNTGKENDATLDFLHNCEKRWQEKFKVELIWLEYDPDAENKFRLVNYQTAHRTNDDSKPSPFEKLLNRYISLPNVVARNCTAELKVRTCKRYVMSLGFENWTSVLGIRYDEPRRWNKNSSEKQRWDNWLPLVERKITKEIIYKDLEKWPFKLELKDYEGNCDLCFLKGIAKKRMIMRDDPTKADWWIRMEKEKGQTWMNGYSYESILKKLSQQPELNFDTSIEQDFECFCNID